jgi:hypothetical protein
MDLKFLVSFKPGDKALRRRISSHIDDAALEQIAGMDPTSRLEEHLVQLRKIRDHGVIDRPLHWIPREVLEFVRWQEPDDPAGKPGQELRGTRGHWMRAFCCSALVRAYGDVETREIEHIGYGLALIQLLESLQRLDAGFEPEAMAALAWHIVRMNEEPYKDEIWSELAFFGVGLLSLAARSGNRVSDATIIALTKWLIAEEQREFDTGGRGGDPNRWLFRIDHIDMLDKKWIALGAELAAFEGGGQRADAVRAIGQRMVGN